VYYTYGDESRDPSKNRVYAVAGAFGHQDDWNVLEALWNERLGSRIFHASDCECDQGVFAATSHEDNQALYRDLVRIVATSKIIGHGVAIDVRGYTQVFPGDLEHTPYIWGFGDVVQISSELAYLSLPQEDVRVIFDRNQELQFSATEMYRYCRSLRRVITRKNLFGDVSFDDRRTIGIQVADLFARETMKHLDNHIGPVYRPERLSFTALRRNDKFRFVCYTREHFEGAIKQFPPDMLPGAQMDEYRKWLIDQRLEDSLTNRIRHIGEFPELSDDEGGRTPKGADFTS
jgi:hypothetical protein